MFMLKYNYLTLRGESTLRPQYLLLYGSHFAVIPVQASPSKIFYFKTSRFVEILSEASPSFNANVLMHCKPRLFHRFFHLAFWASGAVTVLVWPSLTLSVKILLFVDRVLVTYTICVQRGN
jgi:hypothetical protein